MNTPMCEPPDENIVIQPRCVHCLKEQYALAVLGVSAGQLGCSWCGQTAPVFTSDHEYHAALNQAREARDARQPIPEDEYRAALRRAARKRDHDDD